jgi:hypothetical protein
MVIHSNWLKKAFKGGKPGNIAGLQFRGAKSTPGSPLSNGTNNFTFRKLAEDFKKIAEAHKNKHT